jgi:hypothetical protein
MAADHINHADIDHKTAIERVSTDGIPGAEAGHGTLKSKLQPPPLVAAMTPEQRVVAEAKLRRKIDTRLLPMIILMYIMNYLDRNNIAAVRLAGLQDELNLSSTQYQVRGNCLYLLGVGADLIRPSFPSSLWDTS